MLGAGSLAPTATAASSLKMPFPKTTTWWMTQGVHEGDSVDLQPASNRALAPVLAVAGGTATIACADENGMAIVNLSVPGVGTFGYAHLDGNDARSRYGTAGASKSVVQGEVIGKLYSTTGTGCLGQESPAGAHLHLSLPNTQLLFDGVTLDCSKYCHPSFGGSEGRLPAGTNQIVDPGLDAGPSASPSVTVDKQGRVWMFALKEDGDLYYRFTGLKNGNPHGWTKFRKAGTTPWSTSTSPAVTVDKQGRVWMFALKEDGDLYYRFTGLKNGNPHGWTKFRKAGTTPWST